jgi:hypothetical protein
MTVYRLSNTREVNVPERRKVWFRIPAEEEPVMPNVALAVFAAGVRRRHDKIVFLMRLTLQRRPRILTHLLSVKCRGIPIWNTLTVQKLSQGDTCLPQQTTFRALPYISG